MIYKLKLSVEAEEDFENYIDYIEIECNMPMTAAKHKAGILEKLLELSENPHINPIRYSESLRQFGISVRRVNFKKMAIIYTIHTDKVFIHRIVASSMITGL